MTADILLGLSHTLKINLLVRFFSAWHRLYVRVTQFTSPEALCFSAFITGGCDLWNKAKSRNVFLVAASVC